MEEKDLNYIKVLNGYPSDGVLVLIEHVDDECRRALDCKQPKFRLSLSQNSVLSSEPPYQRPAYLFCTG